MGQRLFKAISCVALMVSVFFCSSVISLADDELDVTHSNENMVGNFVLNGVSQEYDVALLSTSDVEHIYQGVSSIHTQMTYASIVYSTSESDLMWGAHSLTQFKLSVPVLFRLAVERGHTYSGQIYFYLHMDFPSMDNSGLGYDYKYRNVTFGGFEQQSIYDGVTMSFYGFQNFGNHADYGTCDVVVCVTFDNFQPTFNGDLNVNGMFDVDFIAQLNGNKPEHQAAIPLFEVMNSVSTDWIGELYDYPTDAIVDSDGTLIKNQTIQQQQIANQQSQQSQQQHNSLINGYDNTANDTMLADKNSVLKGFEQQQDQAMSNGQQYVADFSANYDTAPLQAMAPAFMMISTWFNDLWGGMGNFSTVLFVGLMLCVAGYILKLKH